MVYFVGSSSQTDIGVGTLLRWREDEVEKISVDRNNEEGTFLVEDSSGRLFYCFEVMVLEANLNALEEISFENEEHFKTWLKDMELS